MFASTKPEDVVNDPHTSIRLREIISWLEPYLHAGRIGEGLQVVGASLDRPVERVGLALEPWTGIGAWVERDGFDAVLLHRPWDLAPTAIPRDTAIIACHLAFDRTLGVGFNTRLADVLDMSHLESLGDRRHGPIGMIGRIDTAPLSVLRRVVWQMFDGIEGELHSTDVPVDRIAVAGAIDDDLVREAWARGARLYLTDAMHQSARAAVVETGIAVIVTGPRRAEHWGMRALAGLLRERFASIDVQLAPPGVSDTSQRP